jgi:ATP-binding cassette, subfamily B, bacterial MsbA
MRTLLAARLGLGSDVRYLVSVLSIRYRLGLLTVSLVNVLVVLLDSLGLALLLPLVALITGAAFTGDTDNIVVDWSEQFFSSLGHEFTLTWMVVIVGGTQVVRAIGIFVNVWISALLRAKFEIELQQKAFGSYLSARWEYQERTQLGAVMNTLSVETRRAAGTYNSLAHFAAAATSMTIYLLVILTVSWQLSLAAVLGTSLIAIILYQIIKYSRKIGALRSKATAKLYSELAEFLAGIKFIKSSALEKRSFEQFSSSTQAVARVDSKLGMSQGALQSSAEVFFVLALIIGLFAGSRVFSLSTNQIGLFAFLFFRVFQHAKGFQISLQGLSQDIPALEAVQKLRGDAEAQPESIEGSTFNSLNNDIQLKDVSFAYGDGYEVLSDVNIAIPHGSVVSIVGPSGVGKSTIIDLIAGLLQPANGKVLLDGVGLQTVNLQSWRKNISYVTQEPFLFNDTIANNIAWASDEHDPDKIIEAAKLAGAHEFITNLPDGYQTRLGDRGALISGGQRQRICLARAFVQSPQLLILDEATSELDSRSETLIKNAIDQVAGDMTVLIVAHRSSIVMSSDIVYLLQDGSVIEHGSPSELVDAGGVFASMQP